MKKSILFLALFFGIIFTSNAADPEGYPKVFFKAQSFGANATGTILITEPVDVYNLYFDQTASFSFNYNGSGDQGSGVWEEYTGSTTLLLQPRQLSDNCYLNISNGSTAQTVIIKTFGR